MEPLLIDIQGVAQALELGRRTCERLVAAGDLPPPIRFGRIRRWRIEDIEAWLADLVDRSVATNQKRDPGPTRIDLVDRSVATNQKHNHGPTRTGRPRSGGAL